MRVPALFADGGVRCVRQRYRKGALRHRHGSPLMCDNDRQLSLKKGHARSCASGTATRHSRCSRVSRTMARSSPSGIW